MPVTLVLSWGTSARAASPMGMLLLLGACKHSPADMPHRPLLRNQPSKMPKVIQRRGVLIKFY